MSTPDINPDFRYGFEFGMGELTNPDHAALTIQSSPLQRAYITAWSHGCPDIKELVKPEVFGAEQITKRYLSVNFWFRHFLEVFQEMGNESLYRDCLASVPRAKGEDPLNVDLDVVPPSYAKVLKGITRPDNYAWPRVYIEMLGNEFRTAQRIEQSHALVDLVLERYRPTNSLYFLSILSEQAYKPTDWFVNRKSGDLVRIDASTMVDPKILLSHIFAQELLESENCLGYYIRTLSHFEMFAPRIYGVYQNLTTEDFEKYHIITPDKLAA